MRLAESYSDATIVHTFEMDNKPYATIKMPCDRCGGSGIFYVAVLNGQGVPAAPDGGCCYKCHGAGYIQKDVRMYEEAAYERLVNARAKAAEKRQREYDAAAAERLAAYNIRVLERYGFKDINAYAVLGDTYFISNELKEHGAKFSSDLKWVIPTEPTWLTNNTYVRISVEDVFTVNERGAFELREDVEDFRKALEPLHGTYIGTVGERITLQVLLVRKSVYVSKFGAGAFYTFEDADKNEIVWQTSSAWPEINTNYILVGTIKSHTEYNRSRQTVVTRCKLEEVIQ